jgi:hypothetical protein
MALNKDTFDYECFVAMAFQNHTENLVFKLGRELDLGRKEGYYCYIPTHINVIEDLLKFEISKLENINKLSFLDAGAGTSIIPKIMKSMGFKKSKGLEYQELFVKLDPEWLFKKDILKYNFKDWDVIYSYNPIQNNELMCKGIDNIINTMKPGAIFYFCSASYQISNKLNLLGSKELTRVNNVFKYIKPF